MLSLCFVSQEYPEETGWGGIGTYTFEMAHGLARAGHRVVVISRALDQQSNYVEADGVEVYRVRPAFNLDSTPVLWRLNRYWEGYRLAVALQLRRTLRERHVDLIECPELHAETLLHARFRSRPPLVVRLHSGSALVRNFEGDRDANVKTESRLEQQLLKRAMRITSPSAALLSSMSLNGDAARSTVIPNPVDIDHFKPTGAAKTAAEHPKVVCVGRPREIKGIQVLAQAMPLVWQTIPKTRFIFVPAPMGKGGGSPPDAYREFLGDLINDSRVEIRKPVARPAMPALYSEATLCVVPSLWEGFGYVAAEAMACAGTVIASRVGGLAEIVKGGESGILVEPNNPQQLAGAVIGLINDPERCRQIGLAARTRIVQKFSSPVVTARMGSFYEEVVAEAAQ